MTHVLPPPPGVLPAPPGVDLRDYLAAGGGRGLAGLGLPGRAVVIDVLVAPSLLHPSGEAVAAESTRRALVEQAGAVPGTVVVDAAGGGRRSSPDGPSGSDPFAVLEGALIAAHAVGASRVVVVVDEADTAARAHLDAAVAQVVDAGWCAGPSLVA